MNIEEYKKLPLDKAVIAFTNDNHDFNRILMKANKAGYDKLYNSLSQSVFTELCIRGMINDKEKILEELDKCVKIAIRICNKFSFNKERLNILEEKFSIMLPKKDGIPTLTYNRGNGDQFDNLVFIRNKQGDDIILSVRMGGRQSLTENEYRELVRDNSIGFHNLRETLMRINDALIQEIIERNEIYDNPNNIESIDLKDTHVTK